jgi:poly(3-hydroxybutyrate) depolymerase
MLYQTHEIQRAGLKACFGMATVSLRFQSSLMRAFNMASLANELDAVAEITHRISKDYPKPSFGLNSAFVHEEVILDKPFGSLLHFRRDTTRNDPKILLVAPMSGHYATLLRSLVRDLLPHHDVYITDWKSARDVPSAHGDFSLEDYTAYLHDFMTALGPDVHVTGISQSTVPVLTVTALMASQKSAVQPASITLMCGPIDTRVAPTSIGQFAKEKPLDWFRKNVIATVPQAYPGAGRSVYPGFMQLLGLKLNDMERHTRAITDLYNHVRNDNQVEADKIRSHYDEYDAMMDSSASFYLDTIEQVFQTHTLARGVMTWRDQVVDPSAITKTALLTIEGEKDSICGLGQTMAAHRLCSNLPTKMRFAHVEPGAGHYDVIDARRITGFVRDVAKQAGMTYDQIPDCAALPPQYAQETAIRIQGGNNDNTGARIIHIPPKPNTA